jgi:hypothetical protein
MKKKNRPWIYPFIALVCVLLLLNGCKQDKENNQDVPGFGFLSRIPGLWHGPVSSSTSAGSFDIWYADFRPISAAQTSQFSLLDTNTANDISFFIVKYENQLKIAMRTEGCFKDTCCVTYEVMDSAVESAGYYRFSDFVKGTKRACTVFQFNDDSLTVTVYTNKFNKSDTLVWHSTWTAKLGSRNNASEATSYFTYPQPVMIKNFSNAFDNMTESIFFNFENDPYKSVTQPYVGSVTVNISIDPDLITDTSDEIYLVFTTEPIFEGLTYKEENLKYLSKYVLLSAETSAYKIKNVHPGKYYIYSLIDRNKDNKYLTGDYMSSNITASFTVKEKEDVHINTMIDFIIP